MITIKQLIELLQELDESTQVTAEVNIKTKELRCIVHGEISAKLIKENKLWVEM
jgi:hypothetical protein